MTSTVIQVGGRAPVLRFFADFFEGRSAVVQRVEVVVRETTNGPILEISPPDRAAVRWPFDDIRQVPDQAAQGVLVLSKAHAPIARLLVDNAEARTILLARCKNLKKRVKSRGQARLFVWSAAALASVLLIIFVLIPVIADQLAGYLPPEGEKALGDATFAQIRASIGENPNIPVKICHNPKGVAALGRMQSVLQEHADLPYPLTLNVLDHDIVNAFALPGGHVVLFRGLIDAAQTPDEVASVLAHEIGHVVNRDPARGALRSAGSIGVLGLLFGDFAGGTVTLFLLNRLIDATYSQDAEAKADLFAHEALIAAGIPPAAMADMFERLLAGDEEPGGIVAHFMAHPKLGDRIQIARTASINAVATIRPSLNANDWNALQRVCD